MYTIVLFEFDSVIEPRQAFVIDVIHIISVTKKRQLIFIHTLIAIRPDFSQDVLL